MGTCHVQLLSSVEVDNFIVRLHGCGARLRTLLGKRSLLIYFMLGPKFPTIPCHHHSVSRDGGLQYLIHALHVVVRLSGTKMKLLPML